MSAIKITKIKKSFGKGEAKFEVLHGIDGEIEAGKMTFLVGPSGCGKTTLISIIAGILTPDDGDVEVFCHNILKMKAKENAQFRRENIGFIFQQFNLLPALTALENVAVPLIAGGMERSEAKKKAAEMLEKVDLAPHIKKLPKELSGGQQQRVAIARSLVHDPKLLICDEPTASLDASSGQIVMKLLQEQAKKEDRCVIVVTHDDRIFKFADAMLKMNDGKIISVDNNYTKARAVRKRATTTRKKTTKTTKTTKK